MSTTKTTTGPAFRRTIGDPVVDVAEHWIDGEWTGSDTVSESINPATGDVLGRWADGGEAEARAVIAAARRAFDASLWSRDRNLRHKALSEMADRFDAHADELGPLVTKENGKKLAEGMLEATVAGITLRHAAGQALTDTGISAEFAPGQWFSTYGEPAGVVGVIVPWNSPVVLLDPVSCACPGCGEHGRGEDAGADRARRQSASPRSSPRSSRCRAGWSTSSPSPATRVPRISWPHRM